MSFYSQETNVLLSGGGPGLADANVTSEELRAVKYSLGDSSNSSSPSSPSSASATFSSSASVPVTLLSKLWP
jgi:hypothetical protein